jgi:hypothetical protein
MKMTARIAAALALVCVAAGYSQTAEGPPVPYEDIGACPFEGCVYRQWQANAPVEVHAERKSRSAVVFRVAKGEKVQALTGVVVTIKAGRVQYDRPKRLETSSGPIDIQPGQTLFLLTYQGEGFTKAWFNRRLYAGVDISAITWADGQCGWGDRNKCIGREVEKSETEWWVQVRNAAGQVGWTLETKKFDNKDAFGG